MDAGLHQVSYVRVEQSVGGYLQRMGAVQDLDVGGGMVEPHGSKYVNETCPKYIKRTSLDYFGALGEGNSSSATFVEI